MFEPISVLITAQQFNCSDFDISVKVLVLKVTKKANLELRSKKKKDFFDYGEVPGINIS